MPKLYCSSCGGATDWSSTKPNFCSFCSEPFVKKITSTQHISTIRKVASRFEEQARVMEQIQQEIPTSLDITVEGEKPRKIIVGSTITKENWGTIISADRSEPSMGTPEADRGLPQAKADALKYMLNPTAIR